MRGFRKRSPGQLFLTLALSLLGSLSLLGCDSATFVPPAPDEQSDGAQPGARFIAPPPLLPGSAPKAQVSLATPRESASPRRGKSQAGTIRLIVSHQPDSDDTYLSQAIWREAGKARLRFRFVWPDPHESNFSDRLREALGSAVAGDALLVQLDHNSAPIDLLYDASTRGVTILLLDHPLPPRGSQTLPYVTYESFAQAGRQIASTLLEAARLARATPTDRIILLENRTPHRFRAERIASLADAFKAAGRSNDVVAFEGASDGANAALEKALSTGPPVAIVAAEEDIGLFAAQSVLMKRVEQHQPEFVLGGYYAYDVRTAGNNRKITVFGDPSVEAFAVKAFRTVERLLAGEGVPEKTEIPISVRDYSAAAVAPESNPPDKSRALK